MLMRLWRDEDGAIICAELVMVATVLVVGMMTGLTELRDAVITELSDMVAAVATVDQSITILGVTCHSSATGSTTFVDTQDPADTSGTAQATNCLIINCGSPIEPLPGNEGAGA